MLNVIDNYSDCKYIDSYWLNNIVKAQNEDINKYNINKKYILENMFTGKGNSTNSANSNNTRLSEMVKPIANSTRLAEMVKRDPQVGIIAASWTKPSL